MMESPDATGKASLRGRAPYVTIYLRISAETVTQAMFQTFGCGYSIACCSVLTELITGARIDDCRKLTADDLVNALDEIPPEKRFCAEMAVQAMHDALANLQPVC